MEEEKETYKWWREKLFIDVFNEACKNIEASYMKVEDESTSEISFWTKAKGNLPPLSYILRNPDTPGIEFKKSSCYITGVLIFIESQIGKE